MSDILIYGAYGYTAQLITELAVTQGLQPILAGRNPDRLDAIAQQHKLRARACSLEDATELDAALNDVSTVIHCAGPFSGTSRAMVDACLRTRTHYLDITGEIEVFEAIAKRDEEAKKAGVVLMPGVGFDIVPSDCLAAHLHRRLPDATHLTLAFQSLGGGVSHGTATTIVENLHRPSAVREEGVIRSIPMGSRHRTVDFGKGPKPCVAIPWGDVSTAWYTTQIPNIEVVVPMPTALRWGARLTTAFAPLLSSGPVQRFLKARVDGRPAGPTAEERHNGTTLLWGEARNEAGESVRSRLQTPEGYTLTAHTALHLGHQISQGAPEPGFHTPAGVYGPDLILQFSGTERSDIEES